MHSVDGRTGVSVVEYEHVELRVGTVVDVSNSARASHWIPSATRERGSSTFVASWQLTQIMAFRFRKHCLQISHQKPAFASCRWNIRQV